MKRESFENVLNRINKQDFEDYYFNHNQQSTIDYFSISWGNLKLLIKYWGIVKDDSIIRKCSSNTCKNKKDDRIKLLAEKIPFNKLFQYYEVENHSWEECQKYFELTKNQFFDLLRYYNLHKSWESHNKKSKESKLNNYGDPNYNNREKAKLTCIEKYGVENVSQIAGVQEKNKLLKIEMYGSVNNWPKGQQTRIENCGSLEESYKATHESVTKTCLERYGCIRPISIPEIKEKARENFKAKFQEIYGVDSYFEWGDAKRSNGSKNSSFNLKFSSLLDSFNVEYSSEFYLNGKWFDFKLYDNLIEINPSPTHNSTWSPFGDTHEGIDKNYHLEKTKLALNNNYRCIHIFDWDDKEKIIKSLLPKTTVYARKCEIKEVTKKDIDNFLNNYHFQNTCRGQNIKLGLYYKDELIQIMTFGRPRYNQKYEWELLRLCTKFEYKVVGGAEKLFKYFIKNYNPKSIISYCDNSKFSGDVYNRLGMNIKSKGTPTKHWYNVKDNTHISNNLLLKNGFDRLLGDKYGSTYGKGTSNEELMILHNFVEIYDCGQSSYIWEEKI